MLQSFSCSRNQDVESFLTTPSNAIRFEKSASSRTYLMLDSDTGEIGAYFSVSFKEMLFDLDSISNTATRKIGAKSKTGNERVKAFLIGQIGKNDNYRSQQIRLEEILNEIYSVLAEAQMLVGGRMVILECDDNASLIGLYESHGFKRIESEDSDMVVMYIVISG